MADSSGVKVVSAGVDWLTCTAKARTPEAARLRDLGYEVINAQLGAGYKLGKAKPEGYVAEFTEGVLFGVRDADVMLRLSSDTAALHWRDAVGAAHNVSRCDVQVTWTFPKADPRYGDREYLRLRDLPKVRGKPPALGRHEIDGKGYTLTHGARTSDRWVRMYDKGAQMRRENKAVRIPQGKLWRAEVETRRDMALEAAHKLHGADRPELMARSMVHTELERRRMEPPFPTEGAVPLEKVQRQTDRERRLIYAATVIAPFFGKVFADGDGAILGDAIDFRVPLADRLAKIAAKFPKDVPAWMAELLEAGEGKVSPDP